MTTLLDLPGLRKRISEEPGFAGAVVNLANSLNFDVNSLLGVMSSESGINPKAVNPTGGATGLIQFMPATARALGTTVEALRQMTGVQQLEFVRRFFLPHKDRIRRDEPGDYYIAVFLPAYLGSLRGTVLGVKDSAEIMPKTKFTRGKIYAQNSVFDSPKRGFFTIGDVMAKNENRVATARSKPPLLEVADNVPLVEEGCPGPSSLQADSSSSDSPLPEAGFLRGQTFSVPGIQDEPKK